AGSPGAGGGGRGSRRSKEGGAAGRGGASTDPSFKSPTPQASRPGAEAGGAKSGRRGGRGGRQDAGMPNARAGGEQRRSVLSDITPTRERANAFAPSESLAGSTASSRGHQVKKLDKGSVGADLWATLDPAVKDDLAKVPGDAIIAWVEQKFGRRAGAHVAALVDHARAVGLAGAAGEQAERDKAREAQAALDEELEQLELELDAELEYDQEEVRLLKAHVEQLLSRLAAVANDAQPAAASSSDAQLAAAVAKLEGAFQTIKAQQAEIEALAASIAAAKTAKEAQKVRDKKARAGRRAADAAAIAALQEAMARNNVSPESSVSPESAAGPISPGAPNRLYIGSSGSSPAAPGQGALHLTSPSRKDHYPLKDHQDAGVG
ncbi:hypothetical protein T484DRAFT_1793394, partial [Baffinella frigidus]